MLTSSAGVMWEGVHLHRGLVSLGRSSDDWETARFEFQGTLGDWPIPQLFYYTERDQDWCILAIEGWALSELLDHRLGEVFNFRCLLEEEIA